VSVTGKGRTVTRQGLNLPLALLLDRLAPILRGRTTYFKHGVSKATVDYLRRCTWRRVLLWIRRKHRRELEVDPTPLPALVVAHGRRRGTVRPGKVTVSRYRCRANIASPWLAAKLSPDPSA
jgi:RNA-directed DNA polymerase